MKVKQNDLLPGDIILAAFNGNLRACKIVSETKSGSMKYLFDGTKKDRNEETDNYYDFNLDEEKMTKVGYFAKAWRKDYNRVFWLIKRES